jgi:hypothetical protein
MLEIRRISVSPANLLAASHCTSSSGFSASRLVSPALLYLGPNLVPANPLAIIDVNDPPPPARRTVPNHCSAMT